MPSLRRMDFMSPSCSGLEHQLKFLAKSRHSHFPTLKVVRIIDALDLTAPTNYCFVHRRYVDVLRKWTKAAKTLGIELQTKDGDALEVHRRYRMLHPGGDQAKILEYEYEIDFEEESDDTYESLTSDDSSSESDVSLSCLSHHPEGSHLEQDMDHDTVIRLWDQMQQDERVDAMSDSSECTDWNDSTDEKPET
ncbi:hypothetical protein BD410DRAFT_192195 [Rickenella mellea]|uniref:Uncharacterized protein n=1 Tax=Rickenella mellea TaxID=50990 RepID=A0A4Y7PGI3_9AGAM|nr:hypothetical protein BD410DRAFT_192195 [Rickenella mellea]